MKEFIFTWSIQNISYSWHKTGETIYSPAFTAVPIQNSVWNLQLNPRGSIDDDYLSLFLQRNEDNGPEKISVNFELSCLSSEKLPLYSHFFPEADKSFIQTEAFGHPRFLRRHEIFFQRKSLYLTRDTLTVRCRLWKDEGDISESGESFSLTCLEIERILSVDNIKPQIGRETTVCIHSKLRNKQLISISLLHYEDTIRVVINPTSVENIKFSILKLTFVKKTNRKIFCEHRSSCLGAPVRENWRLNVVKHLDKENEDSSENDVELFSEFTYSTGHETETLEKACPNSPRLSELISKYINSCISSENLSDCPRISQDLWNLYVEHVLCDLELKTKTSSFFVHKIVLCARSSVFLAMLTDDMKEKRNECIEVEDIMDDILKKFLLFLYTDTFEDLEWEAVIGLYYAADKYHVERLKILCCSFLLKHVDVDNACELLLLADKHHDSDFKRRVEDFILQNDKKIFSSSIWKQFVYEQSLLSAMTMLLKYEKERGEEYATETYEEKLSMHPEILDDFRSVYQGKIFSDIRIKTKDATFHAHKSVLCASSSTLKEAFTKDVKDKPSDTLKMEDLEDDTVSRLLVFLYTDSLEDIEWGTAFKLYHAANVYQIQRLKIKYSCFLLENLRTSNAIDLLLLAHQHSDEKLKSVVEDFIFLHDVEIFGSDEWAEFSKANLLLANETMCLKYRKRYDFS